MGKHRYGVVLDAGSSGTRVYVYRWTNAQYALAHDSSTALERLPAIKTKKKWRMKVHPGVSSFGDRPEAVGSEHLEELVRFAKGIVGEQDEAHTPIFLLATAGMRLLPERQRLDLLDSICVYLRQSSDFLLPDCGLHVQVIPGETEGLYGWIAANYLLGGFDEPAKHDHGKDHNTYGFLDMGGASAQIAFAPNKTEAAKHEEDLTLLRLRKINGEALEYKVFVTTWLGFGANEARRRYVEALLDSYPAQELEIPDPCLPTGLQTLLNGTELADGSAAAKGKIPHLLGTGQFKECLARTYPLLEKEAPCKNAPCLLNGQHTPAIDFSVNHFVGVSEYWHTTHQVFASAHGDKAYDFHTYSQQVTEFCSRDWAGIQKDVAGQTWGKKVDTKTVEEVCFKASWLISMLHDGIGVPGKEIDAPSTGTTNKSEQVIDAAKEKGFLDPFQAVDDIDGNEVSWTLGKILLYAASQMPPADESLAVGFGSVPAAGAPAIPVDFQFAGGSSAFLPGDLVDSADDLDGGPGGDDWHDRILAGSGSRRLPGILLFLAILGLAVYLLCGRERRSSWWSRMRPNSGNVNGGSSARKPYKNPPFSSLIQRGSKLFGSSSILSTGPAYERVHDLETGRPSTGGSVNGNALGIGIGVEDASSFELTSLGSGESEHGESPRVGGATRGSAEQQQQQQQQQVQLPHGPMQLQQEAPRTGRASGWATPATRALSPDISRTSPKAKGYFDLAASSQHGYGLGLGITPFDREGLLSRNDSRERLQVGRSRTGSPSALARRSPLITPYKESVD